MRQPVILLLLLVLPACAAPSPGESEDPPPVAQERDPAAREQAARQRLERLERVEQAPPPAAAVGEVPAELLERIRADAAGRLGVEPVALELIRAEAVTWSDGSLGCPQPDVMYTQALEPGFWVVLEAPGQQLDYRARANRHFLVCEPANEKGLPR